MVCPYIIHTLPLMISLPFMLVVTAITGSTLANRALCTARPKHHALLMVSNIHTFLTSLSVKLPKATAQLMLK